MSNNITEITLHFFMESLCISNKGYVRATTMRPSGGFEMRPIVQVYQIDKEAHATLWKLVEALDLEELKKFNSKDYNVSIDITLIDGREVIKVSSEIFETIESLVILKKALVKVRDEKWW